MSCPIFADLIKVARCLPSVGTSAHFRTENNDWTVASPAAERWVWMKRRVWPRSRTRTTARTRSSRPQVKVIAKICNTCAQRSILRPRYRLTLRVHTIEERVCDLSDCGLLLCLRAACLELAVTTLGARLAQLRKFAHPTQKSHTIPV